MNTHTITSQNSSSYSIKTDRIEVLGVSSINCGNGRNIVVLNKSETDRLCTVATSNVVSSLVLSPISTFTPNLTAFLPENLVKLPACFDLAKVIEIKFLRSLETALLLIIAAHKTQALPSIQKTRIQFGCGFGRFEGLHSSLIPEPAFEFKENEFSDYVEKFISDWCSDMDDHLSELQREYDNSSSQRLAVLSKILFGPDLKILAIFLKECPFKDLLQEFATALTKEQAALIDYYREDKKIPFEEILTKEKLSQLQHLMGILPTLKLEVIDCPQNLLAHTHFHLSSNAIDVLPDSMNQFDGMIEDEMREKLLASVLESSSGTFTLSKTCTQFVETLRNHVTLVCKDLEEQHNILQRLLPYHTKIQEQEKALNFFLEPLLEQWETPSKMTPEARFQAIQESHATYLQHYINYLDSLRTIFGLLNKLEKTKLHPQTVTYKNFLLDSLKDIQALFTGFYRNRVTRDDNLWDLLSQTTLDTEAFFGTKFSFLLPSNQVEDFKKATDDVLKHFKELNIKLRAKIYGIDPAVIAKKMEKRKTIVERVDASRNAAQNEVSLTLMKASVLLLSTDGPHVSLVKPIHTICKKMIDKALRKDCGILTDLYVKETYVSLPDSIAKKVPKRSDQELATSLLFAKLGAPTPDDDPSKMISSYLGILDAHLSSASQPLDIAVKLKARIEFAQKIFKFLTSVESDEDVLGKVKRGIVQVNKDYSLSAIVSGVFFQKFSKFVTPADNAPKSETPASNILGLFLQFALSHTNQNALLTQIEDKADETQAKAFTVQVKIIETEIQRSLVPKEEKAKREILLTETLANIDFVLTYGKPALLRILNDFSDSQLKTLTLSEIPVSRATIEEHALTRSVLKDIPLENLAPLLLSSLYSHRYELHTSGSPKPLLADRIYTGRQLRFISIIRYCPETQAFSIDVPKITDDISTEEIAMRIYRIVKDLQIIDLGAFEAEVSIDFFSKD